MVRSYDPSEDVIFAKAITQDLLAECPIYMPRQNPIDWDAIVCIDEYHRVHLGAWPGDNPENDHSKPHPLIHL